MKRLLPLLGIALLFSYSLSFAQTRISLNGKVFDNNGKPLQSVTVSLLKAKDSSLVKADITDEFGSFKITVPDEGKYLLNYTILGFVVKYSPIIEFTDKKDYKAENIILEATTKTLQDVTVVSRKPLIEIKADKTVFNVENSINATGSNALELLQKTPGIQVDNNENISLKGKTGVRIYVDGKITQLGTQELAAYLKGINSDDVEAIEMISNPSARYDASGNAGIINIRLKKNKKFGTNGSMSLGFRQGFTPKGNGAVSLNYRDKKVNLFSNIGTNIGIEENRLDIYRIQLDSIYDQKSKSWSDAKNANAKLGFDLFLNSKNTLGMLVTANLGSSESTNHSHTNIYYNPNNQFVKKLIAQNTVPRSRTNINTNINYRYVDTSGKEINFDADYGLFRGTGRSYQPNFYLDQTGNNLSSVINRNLTPIDIDIYTFKLDVDQSKWKGKLGYGVKFSYVKTSNTFDFFTDINGIPIKVLSRSNSFLNKENVNAAYVNYQSRFTEKWSLQMGLRMEQTNSLGTLTRADGIIQADNTVKRSYLNLFPSASITWIVNEKYTWNMTFSRRIDRPRYQDLNPFENKIDELSYIKGNAFLKPQYTNTIELSQTYNNKLTITMGYSHVKDFTTQTTDTTNNATFVQQKNLGTQRIVSFSIGTPISFTKWWTGYTIAWYNYQMFNGKIGANELKTEIPLFGAYMEHSFILGKGYSAELSGWFNGPNVWGGSWRTSSQGGLDVGIQKQVLKKQGTLKLSATDILLTNPWKAISNFGGLFIKGGGQWEGQTIRLNFSWRFGNTQVNSARQRKTGLESEVGRISQ